MKPIKSIAIAAALLPALGLFPADAQEKSRHMEGLENCAKAESPEPTAERETEPGLSLGIESVPNLRELGGYETADGKKVATGLLYRSNQLHKIPPADMQKIAAFDEMEKNYGTIENYFSDALGIDATAQKNLRDLYLVQE